MYGVICYKGSIIFDVRTEGEGGSGKADKIKRRFHESFRVTHLLCAEIKKSGNFADVISGRPLGRRVSSLYIRGD